MQADPHERAAAVFDAFLRHARDAGASSGSHPRSAPKEGTAPGRNRAGSGAQAGANADATVEDEDTATRPHINAPPPGTEPGQLRDTDPPPPMNRANEFEETPTRESPLSAAMASGLAPLRDDVNLWDEPTRERPEVVREMRAIPAPGDSVMINERSIIVEDDIAMTEPIRPSGSEPRLSGDARADAFVAEMTTLIKYGHSEQVPREIERWVRANPDDLAAHLRVAEFEISRVDPSAGLDRLFTLASRALDRGHGEIARRVVDRVGREAPGDLRVTALRERVARR